MNQLYPEYLYHYTTVEIAENLKNAGKYCFVSCFTEDEKESIPIWNLYSQNGRGIRIKRRSNAFEDKEYHIKEKGRISASARLEFTEGEGIVGTSFSNDFTLTKVEYTDDESLLFPHLDFTLEKSAHLEFINKFGKYKNLHWAFQKEWRYIKFAIPSDQSRIILNKDIYTKYLDILFKKEILNNMEVTLGYNLSPGNKIIVEQLVKKYNDNNNSAVKINNSILTHKLR